MEDWKCRVHTFVGEYIFVGAYVLVGVALLMNLIAFVTKDDFVIFLAFMADALLMFYGLVLMKQGIQEEKSKKRGR